MTAVDEIPFDPDRVAREFGEEPPPDVARRAGGLRWSSAADFLAEEIPEPRWVCKEIVPEGAIGYIGGAPKVLKSWLGLDLAFAAAESGLFCGRFLCPEPRRVLLLQFESSRGAYQRRVRAIAARYGAPPANLSIVSNEPVVFEDPVSMSRVAVTLGEVRPDLLVLDPLAAMTTGDENSAQEMGRLVRQLRAWRDEFGSAIAIVHHTNKLAGGPGAERIRSGLRLRGTTAFYAAAEWALWVDRPDDAAPRVEIRVEQKETEPRRPFAVAFSEARAELVVVADEISVQVSDDELLEAIVARKRQATAQQLAADLGLAERTVRDRMASLVAGRRAYFASGTGRGRTALVYVAPKTAQAGPRLITEREP